MPTPAPGRIERTLAAILSFRIRRRVFLALLGATGWAAMSQAREAGKPSRIGILTNRRDDDNWKRFVAGLKDDGYVEGQNLMIDWRYSEGQVERWPALAGELVGLNVDVIVVTTTPAALAAKKVTITVPIVITAAFDPVGSGLAHSLARPGGNVTGLGLLIPEISAKALALFKEAVPHATRIAVLWNETNPVNALVWKEMEVTAHARGLVLQSQPVLEAGDLDGAFTVLGKNPPDGVFIVFDALLYQYRNRIVEFVEHNRLPAASFFREFAELGGLMSYGANLPDMFHTAATYVSKILDGANPADMPIEQPTRFDLIINLKAAKALALTIPPTLLARANEVIE